MRETFAEAIELNRQLSHLAIAVGDAAGEIFAGCDSLAFGFAQAIGRLLGLLGCRLELRQFRGRGLATGIGTGQRCGPTLDVAGQRLEFGAAADRSGRRRLAGEVDHPVGPTQRVTGGVENLRAANQCGHPRCRDRVDA